MAAHPIIDPPAVGGVGRPAHTPGSYTDGAAERSATWLLDCFENLCRKTLERGGAIDAETLGRFRILTTARPEITDEDRRWARETALSIGHGRFETVMGATRETYLKSPLGKARTAIARADRLTAPITRALAQMSCALTRGDGTDMAERALFDAVLELRLACGDVEVLARLVGEAG